MRGQLGFQARLTVIAASVVALSILVAAIVVYFVARAELLGQVDAGLASRAATASARGNINVGPTELAIAAVPFAVGLAYAGLRLAYANFYDQLGVAPEEVGLGQFELLARSFGLVVVVVILFGVFMALVVLPLLALIGAILGVAATDWMLRELPWWALLPLALVRETVRRLGIPMSRRCSAVVNTMLPSTGGQNR